MKNCPTDFFPPSVICLKVNLYRVNGLIGNRKSVDLYYVTIHFHPLQLP